MDGLWRGEETLNAPIKGSDSVSFLFLCFRCGVAFTGQCAVGAVAAAGTLPCFLVTDHADDRKRDQCSYPREYQDVYPILRKPLQHLITLSDQTLIAPVYFLAGLNTRKQSPARTAIAKIRPITFTAPVKRRPNWYTMSEIA